MNDKNSGAILGICLLLGFAIGGALIGNGFAKGMGDSRFVTVKGLAEREVMADTAIWPLQFKVASDDLTVIREEIEKKRSVVVKFLKNYGFSNEEISHATPKITDTKTQRVYGENYSSPYRYIAEITVILRTTNVVKTKEAMEKSDEIIGMGIAISEENWRNNTEFLFMGLNEIKPKMIEEATKNAREAAEKFATDSGSKIGKIRHATQGLFSIADRDRNSPDYKNIRVVTTIQYYLTDK